MTAAEPEFHPVQLVDVWLDSSRTERKPTRDGDPEGPTVGIPTVRLRSSTPERDGFICALTASMTLGVDGETWRASAVVCGSFVSRPLKPTELRHFVRAAALYVMWPYARIFMDQLARMARVAGPALPLFVRAPD